MSKSRSKRTDAHSPANAARHVLRLLDEPGGRLLLRLLTKHVVEGLTTDERHHPSTELGAILEYAAACAAADAADLAYVRIAPSAYPLSNVGKEAIWRLARDAEAKLRQVASGVVAQDDAIASAVAAVQRRAKSRN